jgi:REP element-mobilizing transposase RayT
MRSKKIYKLGNKFKDKFRIGSTRMQNWDYGWNAFYYVTICTGGREYYFGDILDNMVRLSKIGELADKFWMEIPNHFEYVKLDEYIIMPNHIHGIIVIDKPGGQKNNVVETRHCVETRHFVVETCLYE